MSLAVTVGDGAAVFRLKLPCADMVLLGKSVRRRSALLETVGLASPVLEVSIVIVGA
jgi:hypothetical protein